jgi:endonuclease YncB( thermonuclease family)
VGLGSVRLPLPSSSTKAKAILLSAALALSAAGLTGLIAVMPATKSRPEKRGPVVAVEGASPAVSAAKAPERLATPNGPVPDIILDPPYVVLDATSFKNGLSEIQLLDIEGPTGNAVCKDAEGLRWACGLRARAALHNLLRASTLRCRSVNDITAKRFGAYCAITGDDVGAALVRNGWARPRSDAYAAEVAEARRNRAGLWNGDWTIEPSR